VRYIGNKTKLLGFIGAVLRHRGIGPGTAVDPFAGTASVARALKRWGFRVVAADVMQYAYTFGRAYVELGRTPDLGRLAPELGIARPSPAAVAGFLNRLPPEPGFLHDNFTPGGGNARVSWRRLESVSWLGGVLSATVILLTCAGSPNKPCGPTHTQPQAPRAGERVD
jgi:hypothetical protein